VERKNTLDQQMKQNINEGERLRAQEQSFRVQ
jgi:hypothetical protein